MKLVSDYWVDVIAKHEEIENPDWSQVQQAICRLDADVRTAVTVSLEDGSHIGVGGGGGRFMVFYGTAFTEDEAYFTLIDPNKSEIEEENLVTGGQPGIFPANKIVNLEFALRAAQTFFETGRRDPELSWVQE